MFMNVKVGQLRAHDYKTDALQEACRLTEQTEQAIYTVQVISRTEPKPRFPKNHGKEWTREEDTTLLIQYMSGMHTPEELAPQYERTTWSIQCRLNSLGLGKVLADTNYRGW